MTTPSYRSISESDDEENVLSIPSRQPLSVKDYKLYGFAQGESAYKCSN